MMKINERKVMQGLKGKNAKKKTKKELLGHEHPALEKNRGVSYIIIKQLRAIWKQ